MPTVEIPQGVIEKDHELDNRTERASEALAKHRWHHTLDPKGPGYSFRAYANAVGRSDMTIRRHAKGYALFVDRASGATPGVALTIEDAIRLSERSEEQRGFDEAIAEGSGKPVSQVSRGDNRHRTRAVIERAQQRAERRGTDAVDEARNIAREERQIAESRSRHEAERRQAHDLKYVHIEGHLAYAQRRLGDALREAQSVDFTDEELGLIRHSLAHIKALLNLIDLRMAGTPDIDWNEELAKLDIEDKL